MLKLTFVSGAPALGSSPLRSVPGAPLVARKAESPTARSDEDKICEGPATAEVVGEPSVGAGASNTAGRSSAEAGGVILTGSGFATAVEGASTICASIPAPDGADECALAGIGAGAGDLRPALLGGVFGGDGALRTDISAEGGVGDRIVAVGGRRVSGGGDFRSEANEGIGGGGGGVPRPGASVRCAGVGGRDRFWSGPRARSASIAGDEATSGGACTSDEFDRGGARSAAGSGSSLPTNS